MTVLPRVRARLDDASRALAQLYAPTQFASVTIAVGRGKPVGVTDAPGVINGLEALCAINYLDSNVEDRFVHVIVYEYAHVQQALQAPAFCHDGKPTVVAGSLIEGAAEFTAELISGIGRPSRSYKAEWAGGNIRLSSLWVVRYEVRAHACGGEGRPASLPPTIVVMVSNPDGNIC